MNKITILLLLTFTVQAYGQRIRVLSENTGKPIENVTIFNSSREKAAITDALGFTGELPFSEGDTIIFRHPSYNIVTYSYTELAQKKIIFLGKRNILIDEFVISASKSRESKQVLPFTVSVVEEKAMVQSQAQTSADLLLSTGNILVQKTQAGGGSPILRGFEANKILLVVDGVRLNNAIYRSGHLQNSITIDNAILERTEVIFGPSSLIYGSDALGGVIHYYTKDPLMAEEYKTEIGGKAYAQYSTANKGKVGHISMNIAGKKFGSLTSITYKDFGEIRIGSNRNLFYGDWGKTPHYAERFFDRDSMLNNPDDNVQKYTGYSQMDIVQKFKYIVSPYVDWTMNLQLSTSSNIHRIDKLNDYKNGILKYAEYYYGPQNRLLVSVKNQNRNDNKLFTHATSTFAYQRIDEDRISRKFGSIDRLFQLETVNVLSTNIDLLKVWNINRKLNYGYDLIYNLVGSGAHYQNISTDELMPAQTRYPSGGSQTLSTSVYGNYKRIFKNDLVFNAGLRFNFSSLHSVYNNPALPFNQTDINNGAVTGSTSLVYHPSKQWQINAILSTGYRNPNVDDYGKVRAKDDYILVPNNDIKPEYTYNAELGVSRILEGFIRLDAVGYYTYLTNAIVRTNYSMDGQDSLMYDGDMYKIATNHNASRAYIYGATINVLSDFSQKIILKGSLNYAKGWNLSDDVPLGHIPPVFGRVSISYNYKDFQFQSFVYYNGWKYSQDFSPFGEDNDEEATVFGYPAWYTFNISSSYRITNTIMLQLSIENIFDQFYKPYASGVSAPGRNFIFSIRTSF